MSYKDEWILLETADDIDEIEHREPTEEFFFTRRSQKEILIKSVRIANRIVLLRRRG